MKKLFTTIIYLTTTFISFGQASPRTDENEKILKYDAAWSGKFRLEDSYGLIVQSKLTKDEMNNLLSDFPSGMTLYQDYLKSKSTTQILSGVTGGLAIVGLGMVFSNLNSDPHSVSSLENQTKRNIGFGLIGGGVAIGLVNIGVSASAAKKAKKVINAYNSFNSNKYTLQIGFNQNGFGLAFNF